MMDFRTYFKRYGKVYGVSYKYSFGKWQGYIEEFDDINKAVEWLETEEGDFRTRELGSLSYCKSRLK